MPRTARVIVDGGTYHVLTRGNNSQRVFHDDRDYERYLELLSTSLQEHQLKLYHFVLMPDHVHLVLEVRQRGGLSQAMRSLNLRYALFYQRRYRYRGHLWQGRFKSLWLDRERDLLECGRFVELNPVRAGLVDHPRDYAWSSYPVYAEGHEHPCLVPHPLYEALGRSANERQQQYRQFVQEGLCKNATTPAIAHRPIMGIPLPHTPGQNGRTFIFAGRSSGRPRKLQIEVPNGTGP